MSLADVSPSDAVQDVTDDSTPDAPTPGDTGTSLTDVLLSTSPDLAARDVQDRHDVGPAGAHVLIMIRKMLAAAVPATSDSSGMPAIGNGALAGYHWAFARDGDDQDDHADDTDTAVPGDDDLEAQDTIDPAQGGSTR